MRTKFWQEILKKRDHMEDCSVERKCVCALDSFG
jgi:hypothetical protein